MIENGSQDGPIGEFFESIQVRSTDRGLVMEALRRTMHSMGFQPVDPAELPPFEGPIQEEIEVEARRFFVGPPLNGWVPLYPSSDLPEQLAAAQRISEETHAPTLLLNLHNGDVFYYWLFQEGRLADQYDSSPDYFGEPRSTEELEAVRGHPERLEAILPAGVTADELQAVLTQTFAEDEMQDPDPDELILWGDEQFAEFTRLLGIPNAAHSYADAKTVGLEGFVEQAQDFVELAFAPPLRNGGS